MLCSVGAEAVAVLRCGPGPREVVIRPMMYLALTYDHRLVDGREAVRAPSLEHGRLDPIARPEVTFLCSVRDKVEDPQRMLLGL